MTGSSDVDTLKEQIKELEQQIAEEREEFEWDLKAARESSAGTIRRLEDENAQLKKGASGAGLSAKGTGSSSDVDLLTKRALMAERRVAELQQELKRSSSMAPPPIPKEDSVQRLRAESAEKERDDLRREKRALERSLNEKETVHSRVLKELDETKGFKRQLENAKQELADKEKELKQARQSAEGTSGLQAEVTDFKQQLDSEKDESEKLSADLKEKEQKISELAQELNSLAAIEAERDGLAEELSEARQEIQKVQESQEKDKVDHAKSGEEKDKINLKRIDELEGEVSQLNQDLAKLKMASGQMVEQRERESERLKTDLEEAQDRDSQTEGQLQKSKQEISNFKSELAIVNRERDELVEQLRVFREREQTQVTKQPSQQETAAAAEAGSDLFDVGQQAAPDSGDQASSHPAASMPETVADVDESAMPVITGEIESSAVSDAEDIFAEDVNTEDVRTDKAIEPPQLDGMPQDQPLPEPPVEAALEEPKPAEAQGPGSDSLDDFDSGDIDEATQPAADVSVPATADGPAGIGGQADLNNLPDLDVSTAEVPDLDESDQVPDLDEPESPEFQQTDQEQAVPDLSTPERESTEVVKRPEKPGKPGEDLPMEPAAKLRESKGGSGLVLKLGLFGLLAGGLVVGALHFFPIWFGVGDSADTGTDPVLVDGGTSPPESDVDGGLAVALGDASAGGDAAAEEETADQDETVDAGEGAHEDSPDPGPDPELQKAQKQAFKLLRRKKYRKVLKLTKKLVRDHPEDPTSHYLYGRALFYNKKRRDAAAELEKAIELDPKLADAYYELGGIYLIMRNKGQACEALRAFTNMAKSSDRRVAGVRKHLKKLKCP
ncbi:MAG: tetratricopeptide repeat protein [Deltaproteobacteria bacterium]|nr:tetratricopeptide repeat protein [Deltaproteobacteria bacterium]